MLRRIVAAIILVPVAVLIIAFAVANREAVTVSLDPFSGHDPAATVSLPLFALVIALLIIGVLIGGAASWLRQGKWRGAARRFERELHVLRGKLAALEGMEESSGGVRREIDPP
ncbi:MAG: LapA family protein, partial [Xanthobacteraceae bacterium]